MNRKKKSMSGWVGMVPENEYCSWVGRSAGAMIAEKFIARKKKCCQNWYLKCTFSKTACVRLAPLNNAMHSQHQDTTVERRHALAQRTAQWADWPFYSGEGEMDAFASRTLRLRRQPKKVFRSNWNWIILVLERRISGPHPITAPRRACERALYSVSVASFFPCLLIAFRFFGWRLAIFNEPPPSSMCVSAAVWVCVWMCVRDEQMGHFGGNRAHKLTTRYFTKKQMA